MKKLLAAVVLVALSAWFVHLAGLNESRIKQVLAITPIEYVGVNQDGDRHFILSNGEHVWLKKGEEF